MATKTPHVLVVGGSRGIGLAIAQLFARKSYRCTLLSRSEEHLKAALATLQLLSGSTAPKNHACIAGDINDVNSNSTYGFITTHLPPPPFREPEHPSTIDVLVNCAGISQAQLLKSMDHVHINNIMTTNLTAMMTTTQFLLANRYLRRRKAPKDSAAPSKESNKNPVGSPVIINVSSLLGLKGGQGAVAYAASKAGVIGFTRALATEYASHHVRVNCLVPGYVDTDMTKDLKQGALSKTIPLGRFGMPEEVAHAALFLAENEYAHNCVLNLDGGLSAM